MCGGGAGVGAVSLGAFYSTRLSGTRLNPVTAGGVGVTGVMGATGAAGNVTAAADNDFPVVAAVTVAVVAPLAAPVPAASCHAP